MRKGEKMSAEQRAVISASLRGRNLSPEHRANLSAAMSGPKNPRWGKYGPKNPMWGKKHSKKTRKEMSETRKGKQRGPKNPRWLGGISREPYGWKFNAELREEVRRRDGYKCQLCGVPQAECTRVLDCHHLDYCKKNNDPVNLVALCRSCHSRVNANRKRWMRLFQERATERALW